MWQAGGPPVLHRITLGKLLTQHVVKDDSWVPTSGSPPCWWWGYQSLTTGSKWAAIFPLAQWFSIGGPWLISGPQHASRVDHERLCTSKMGLHAEWGWEILAQMKSDTDQHLCTRGAITLYLSIFLEIKFTVMISHVYPSDIVIVISKFLLKRATKICGPLKWATARKRLRTTGLA